MSGSTKYIKERVDFMKIAVPIEGNNVSQHFGKCEEFSIIEIENAKVKNKSVISTAGNQHGLLPGYLAALDVKVIIAGGMGEGARQNLLDNGIEIIAGVSGNIDEAVNAYEW